MGFLETLKDAQLQAELLASKLERFRDGLADRVDSMTDVLHEGIVRGTVDPNVIQTDVARRLAARENAARDE